MNKTSEKILEYRKRRKAMDKAFFELMGSSFLGWSSLVAAIISPGYVALIFGVVVVMCAKWGYNAINTKKAFEVWEPEFINGLSRDEFELWRATK